MTILMMMIVSTQRRAWSYNSYVIVYMVMQGGEPDLIKSNSNSK